MNPNIAQVGLATRFKPGNNGGPGRPKRLPFTRALELALKTRIPENEKGKLKHLAGRRLVTAAVVGVLRRAAEGDPAAFKEIKTTIQGADESELQTGPPQITVNLISVAPQQFASVSQESDTAIVVHTEAIGKAD